MPRSAAQAALVVSAPKDSAATGLTLRRIWGLPRQAWWMIRQLAPDPRLTQIEIAR
jgi:hypothetical protein